MVKSLRRWQNREITLRVGEDTYSGKILMEERDLPPYLTEFRKNVRHYYLKTNDGEKIDLFARRVTPRGSNLLLLLDS